MYIQYIYICKYVQRTIVHIRYNIILCKIEQKNIQTEEIARTSGLRYVLKIDSAKEI